MHSIALKVNNNAYDHLIYFLSNLKDDVEVIQDKVLENEFQTDEQHCIRTSNKIKSGDTDDFKPIDDVDKHIQELINDIS